MRAKPPHCDNFPRHDNFVRIERIRILASTMCMMASLTMAAPLMAQWDFGEPVRTPGVDLGRSTSQGGVSLSHDGFTVCFHANRRPGPEYPIGDFYPYNATRDTIDSPLSFLRAGGMPGGFRHSG